MKGNIIVELYISGKPKINGSLMLNNEGIIAIFPIVLSCFDLLNNVKIASPSVAPLPPIAINVHQNGSVTIYGSATAAVPAAKAAWLAVKLFIKNVSNGPVITVSWIPNHQKIITINANITTPQILSTILTIGVIISCIIAGIPTPVKFNNTASTVATATKTITIGTRFPIDSASAGGTPPPSKLMYPTFLSDKNLYNSKDTIVTNIATNKPFPSR